MGKSMKFREDSMFAGEHTDFEFINCAGGLRVIKNGQEVVNRYQKADAVKRFIRVCVDMDEWKHSWHESLEYQNRENKKILREIIKGKIARRKQEIETLEFGLIAMSRDLMK